MARAIDNLSANEPVCRDLRYRVELTVSCRDCEAIPKVDNAGQVIVAGGTSIQLMHNGVRVVAGGYYGEWMTEIIRRLEGHHEPQEEAVFHEILKHLPPQATMLELGGFWSYYSLWFLDSQPDRRRAFVVEPDPNHLAVGRANAALNGHDHRITFVQASVGSKPHPKQSFTAETVGDIRIPQISVPAFLGEHAISSLDILHCDTQGAETDIVRSCEDLFKHHKVRFGIFSTHSHHATGDPLTHQRCLAMLQDFGGRILAEHDVHESFSCDGLIAAYFGSNDLDWNRPKISLNRYSTSLFRNPLYDLAEVKIRGQRWARSKLSGDNGEHAPLDPVCEERLLDRPVRTSVHLKLKDTSLIRGLRNALKRLRR